MISPKGNLKRTSRNRFTREQYPDQVAYERTYMQKSDSYSTAIEPHEQLLLELQHQITQLLPLRKTFPNLLFYYEQLKSNYEDLLNQMHETHYMKSFTGLKGKEVGQLSTKLRESEVEYQELSDYFNLHLLQKLNKSKNQNKLYCQNLNSIQQNLQQLKQQSKALKLDKDVLKNHYERLLKDSALIEHLCAQDKHKLKELAFSVQKVTITQKEAQIRLSHLKNQQTSKYDLQSQLLSDVLEKRNKCEDFTQKEKQLNLQAEFAQKLKKQLIFHQNLSQQKSIKAKSLKEMKLLEYETALKESKLLEDEISRVENENHLHRQLMGEINEKEIPELSNLFEVSKEENQKAHQFLSYLQQYEKQLKQTSNLMFQQLQDSCKQDYQKLLKPNPNLLNTNIHTLLSLKRSVKDYNNEFEGEAENKRENNLYLMRDLSNSMSY